MMHSAIDETALLGLAHMVGKTGYNFVTVTPATHLLVNSRPENRWGHSLQDIFGWSRPFQQHVLPAVMFDLMMKAGVLAEHEDGMRSLIRFSSLDGNMFVHSAFPTTAADSVFFGPDTYKFVNAVNAQLERRKIPIKRAVDICTGAGPGGLAIAKAVPDAETFLVDINNTALSMARVNLALAGLEHATPRNSDLLSGVPDNFDFITAHPPYLVDRGTRLYRHGGGLLGAELALNIVQAAMNRLNTGGTLLLFTGVAIINGQDQFLDEIRSLVPGSSFDWKYREVDVDVFGEELLHEPYSHVDRIALVVLTLTRHG